MGFTDEFLSLRNKKKKETEKETKTSTSDSFTKEFLSLRAEEKNSALDWQDDEIAPVRETETAEKRSWFQSGAYGKLENRFADGWQFGDVTKTLLDLGKAARATETDVLENLGTVILGIGEEIVDTGAILGTIMNKGSMSQAAQSEIMYNAISGNKESPTETLKRYDEAQYKVEKETSKFVAKDLYNEEKIARKIISEPFEKATGMNVDEDSVLGEKSDALVQSVGRLLAQVGVNSLLPGSGMALMGATAFGSEAESAFQQGATFDEGALSATISAGAEMLTEKIGGVKFGGKTLTDLAFSKLSSKMTSKLASALIATGKITADALAEGGEELLSGYMGAIGQKLTYMEDKEIEELFSKEDALESFIGGVVLGGISGSVEATAQGKGYVTGLNKSEQEVVDKVYENAVAEQEKGGKKLTSKEKSKLYDDIVENMDKGNIEIDTIEEVLGGSTYEEYKSITDKENALKDELAELQKMEYGKMNDLQHTRLNELKGMNLDDTTKRDALKKQLADEVYGIAKNSRLVESYNEVARKREAFNADLTQYDEKQRVAVERAIKSGVLNNTNKSHALVNTLAKIEADKGIVFDYTNNEKLKELGFALEGKTVNGFANKSKGTVTLNVQSAKAWQSTVGHEIGHILKGTDAFAELQNTLFKYAESKGELASRKATLTELYNGIDADIDEELTCDLIGDYLFSDKNFINELTGNISTFKKIWNEVKYLCKVATGKQLTEIEKVRQEFDKVWKEYSAKSVTEDDGKINLSISGTNALTANKNKLYDAMRRTAFGEDAETVRKDTGWYKGKDNKWRFYIADNEMEVVGAIGTDNSATLGDYIEHNKLFAAYPELKNINVRFSELGDTKNGKYSLKDNEIVLNNKLKGDIEKQKNTLIHEIQHAIQDIEGFAVGGNRRTGFVYAFNMAYDKAKNSSEFGQLKSKKEKYDYIVSVAKNLFNATDENELQYKAYQNLYGETEARQVAQNRLFDEDLLQLATPDTSGNVINLDHETKKIIDNLTKIGYTEEEIKSLLEGVGNDKSGSVGDIEGGSQGNEKLGMLQRGQLHLGISTSGIDGTDGGNQGASRDNRRGIYTDTPKSSNTERLGGRITTENEIAPVKQTSSSDGVFFDANFSLSAETDTEYMSAVAKGDMETAQRLVNEAAEKSGYTNNDDYKISHSAPYSQIDKEHFTDLDKLQELYEESADLNLFAIANGISLQPDDYFSPNGARWYMYDDADGMESYRAIKPAMNSIQQQMQQYGEVREMPTIKVYRAVPKSLKESKLQSGGQWVTPSYRYAVKHGNNALNGKYKIIEEIVSAENLWWDGNDIREWGFDDGTNYAYRDTKNNRKLLDAVTYDDEGNVIPLSKRFNYRNADERYSLSNKGEQFAPIGNYSTPLNETALAPTKEVVAENTTPTETVADNAMVEDVAPMPTDADAPPIMETEYYNTPNTTAIDDKALNNIGKSLRETLSLTVEETKAIQEIVQEYSTSEMPSKEELFTKIREQFGEKFTRIKLDEVADVKKYLRTTKVNISKEIKADIVDYAQFRKRNQNKIAFSKDGLSVDKYYDVLVTEFPDFFNYGVDEVYGDLTVPSNQLRKIEAVANREIYDYKTDMLNDDTIQQAVDIISNEVTNYKNTLNRTAAEDTARETLDSIAPPKAIQLTNGSRGDALLNQSLDNYPIKTVEDRINENIRAVEGRIADTQALRRESNVDIDKEIERLSNEYLSKKDKNTQVANKLISRIAKLHERKATIDANFAKTISDLESRLEKMNTEQYNRAMHKQDKMQEHAKWAEDLLGDTSTWKDKKMGLQYSTNTEHRNLRDIVRDENGSKDIAKADAIYDATMGEYNRNQAARNRREAEINKKYEALKVNRVESVYANMLGELRHNPDTTLTEKVVNEYYKKHKNKIDTEKVDKFIDYVRSDLDTFFEELNAKLREQGMKEIPYRKGYFPHKVEPKQNFIQKLLNWEVQDNEIPTSIAGLTEDFKPVKSWQSFDKQRHSDETDYDLLRLFQNYKQGALDWIYHIEDIQKRRAIENHIRYTHSDEGIQARIKEVYANEELDADEAQAQIEHILTEAKNPLNNFVQDFTTHTNILTGKKNSLDRTTEQMTNRKIYTVMMNVQNRTSANMVLANVRSALTNFIPITQSWAQVSPLQSLQATKDTIANAIKEDGLINKSTFLTNRLRETDSLYKTNWDKILDKAGIMFEIVDNFSSQVIWRSKYNQNLANGMSESEAIANADQFAENVMAGRSKGNEPTLFNAKNPLVKAFTMFQLEVNNQYGYFFKDAPNDLKAETEHWKLNLAKGYTTAFIGAYVYNALLEQVAGSGAALDPIGIIEDLLKDLGLFDDDEEEETADVIMNFIENVGGELPFVGGTLFGGGRIPISSALPYGDNGLVEGIGDFAEDVSEGNWGNIGKEMMAPILNVGFPVAGGQIKKTYQGLKMFDTNEEHPVAGSYTDSGALRFPVDDTLGNRIQAGIFGQYANKNAREYFDNGYAPLKEKQIDEYMDVDLPIADYWKYREGLKGLKKNAEKADYINSLDIADWQKNLLMNNILDRKEDVDMSNYDDYGSYEEFDYAQKNPEKYEFFKENGISYDYYSSLDEDGKAACTWAYNNPEKYKVSKVITDNVVEYRSYTSDLYDIKADKDAYGDTIMGSGKEKKVEYINSLDLEYGQKIILFKMQYKSDDTYNADIIDYLNNLDNLTYDERIAIFTELGFTVQDGYVYWD